MAPSVASIVQQPRLHCTLLLVWSLTAIPVMADELKIEKLLRQLGSASFVEREEATRDLIAFGESILPVLREAAKSPDFEVAKRARQIITEIEQKQTINSAVAGLIDSNPGKRASAAEALRQLGPAAQAAVPALIGLLKDPDSKVRNRSAAALGRIGQASREAVPALLEMALDEKEPQETRLLAVGSLWFIGPDAREALARVHRATEGKISAKAHQALHDLERKQQIRP
jgi:HEAT repeat protein